MQFQELSETIREFLKGRQLDETSRLELAGTAGSQRYYYRIYKKLSSYIILISPDSDQDFGRFLRLTQFYRLLDFPVPQVYCIDDGSHQVLLEDLGHDRLFDLKNNPKISLQEVYMQAIDTLLELQTHCFQKHEECPDILSRVFGKSDLLWETEYFKNEFLLKNRSVTLKNSTALKLQEEFSSLAEQVVLHPKTIMHRDFQSQNIMVQNGKIRVIDYQGSRLGSRFYDLASLLLDPYMEFNEPFIHKLFGYYHTRSAMSLDHDSAYKCFIDAGCQRVMQALGAYCYLSRTKGLREFEQYIKPACRILSRIFKEAGREELAAILGETLTEA